MRPHPHLLQADADEGVLQAPQAGRLAVGGRLGQRGGGGRCGGRPRVCMDLCGARAEALAEGQCEEETQGRMAWHGPALERAVRTGTHARACKHRQRGRGPARAGQRLPAVVLARQRQAAWQRAGRQPVIDAAEQAVQGLPGAGSRLLATCTRPERGAPCPPGLSDHRIGGAEHRCAAGDVVDTHGHARGIGAGRQRHRELQVR